MDIISIRNEIDAVDSELLSLFEKRMELCAMVADYKREHNMPVFQASREGEVISRIREKASDGNENGAEVLFGSIMDISKCLQKQRLTSSEAFNSKGESVLASMTISSDVNALHRLLTKLAVFGAKILRLEAKPVCAGSRLRLLIEFSSEHENEGALIGLLGEETENFALVNDWE